MPNKFNPRLFEGVMRVRPPRDPSNVHIPIIPIIACGLEWFSIDVDAGPADKLGHPVAIHQFPAAPVNHPDYDEYMEAHYTQAVELAEIINEGLAARSRK